MTENLWRFETRDRVTVERVVELYDVLDDEGRVDEKAGQWRRRTIPEFAAAIVAASVGLEDPWLDVQDFHGSLRVEVSGSRPTTEAERAEYDRRDKMAWLAAKGIYKRGLAKWGKP